MSEQSSSVRERRGKELAGVSLGLGISIFWLESVTCLSSGHLLNALNLFVLLGLLVDGFHTQLWLFCGCKPWLRGACRRVVVPEEVGYTGCVLERKLGWLVGSFC